MSELVQFAERGSQSLGEFRVIEVIGAIWCTLAVVFHLLHQLHRTTFYLFLLANTISSHNGQESFHCNSVSVLTSSSGHVFDLDHPLARRTRSLLNIGRTRLQALAHSLDTILKATHASSLHTHTDIWQTNPRGRETVPRREIWPLSGYEASTVARRLHFLVSHDFRHKLGYVHSPRAPSLELECVVVLGFDRILELF